MEEYDFFLGIGNAPLLAVRMRIILNPAARPGSAI